MIMSSNNKLYHIERYLTEKFSEISENSNSKTLERYIEDFDNILILGNPGIGKSHELRNLFERTWRSKEITGQVPFLIKLNSFRITDKFEDLIKYKEWRGLPAMIFLLDGLDEIANISDFISALNSFKKANDDIKIKYILTCRYNIFQKYYVELNDFKKLYLQELTLAEIKKILQEKHSLDIKKVDIPAISDFLSNPFNLERFIEYFNDKNNSPDNLAKLYDFTSKKILQEHFKKNVKRGFNSYNLQVLISDLEKIALYNELVQNTSIDPKKIDVLLKCSEQSVYESPLLEHIDIGVTNQYKFTHRQFQEYFVAKLLSELNSNKILELITVDNETLNPSLFNSVTFLINILYDENKKQDLLNWLTENEPELLFNADTDRVSSYRENVFQSYFQKNCIDTTIWFNQASSVPLDRIARFADSDVNFEYLLGIAEEKTYNFRIRTSAIEVLGHFKSRKDNNTKERLFGLLSPNKHDGYININSSIIRLFLSWKLYKTYNELIIHIINKFEGDDHSAITNGILRLIHADIKNVGSYKGFLNREFEYIFNDEKRNNDDKVSRGNRWTFEQIIEEFESNELYFEYLKKLINSKYIEYNYEETFFKRYSNKLEQINLTDEGRELIIRFFAELLTDKKEDYRTRDIAFILLKNLSLEYELFQMLFNPTNFKKLYHVCARLYVLDSRCHIVLEEKIDDFISIKPELEYFRNVITSYGKNNEAVKVENLITQKGYKLKESVSDKPSYVTIKDEYFKKSQQDLENIFDVDYLSNKIQEYFESNQPLFSVNKYYDKLDEYNPLYMKFGYNAPEYLFLLDLARFEDKEEMTKDFCIEKLTNWKYHSHFVFNFISNLLNDSNKQTLDFSGVSKKLQLVIDQFIQNADFNKMIIFNENGRHSYSCYLTFTSVQNIHEIMFKNELNIKVPDDFILKTISFFGYKSYSLQLSDFEKITNLVDDKVKLRTKICSNLKNKLLFQIKEVHILFALKHNYVESFIDIRSYFLEIDEIYNHDKLLDAYVEKQGISILKELITTKGVESRSCWASINILLKSEKDEQLQINTALNYLSLCKSENLKEKLFLENASNILFHYNRTEIIDFIVEDLPNRLNIIFRNSMVNFLNYNCLPSSGTESLVKLFNEIYKPRDKEDYTLAYLNRFFSTYLTNLVKNKDLFVELNILFTKLKLEIEEANDENKQYYINQVLRDIRNAYINKLSKGLEHDEAIRIIKNLDI